MVVFIHDARGGPFACAIDDLCAACIQVLADPDDLTRFYEDVAVLQPAFFFVCPDGGVLYEQVMLGREPVPAVAVEGIEYFAQAFGAFAGRCCGVGRAGFGKGCRPDDEVARGIGAVAKEDVAVDCAAEMGGSAGAAAASSAGSCAVGTRGVLCATEEEADQFAVVAKFSREGVLADN